jgi:hypothetical protein
MPAQIQPFGRSARLGSEDIEFAIQDMTDDMDHLTLLKVAAAATADGARPPSRVNLHIYVL